MQIRIGVSEPEPNLSFEIGLTRLQSDMNTFEIGFTRFQSDVNTYVKKSEMEFARLPSEHT